MRRKTYSRYPDEATFQFDGKASTIFTWLTKAGNRLLQEWLDEPWNPYRRAWFEPKASPSAVRRLVGRIRIIDGEDGQVVMSAELTPVDPGLTVIALSFHPDVGPYVGQLMSAVADRWRLVSCDGDIPKFAPVRPLSPGVARTDPDSTVAPKKLPDPQKESARKPTIKTIERAGLYRQIKDQHPGWSYARVANWANTQEKSTEHTGDTVRNAYRALGWPWERPDRSR